MLLSHKFVENAIPESYCIVNEKKLTNASHDYASQDKEVSVSIDSRKLEPGQLFIPLAGEQVDGHAFIKQALQKGACASLIHDESVLAGISNKLKKNKLFIVVPNTMTALVDLAKAWRTKHKARFVGVTGSVGKTTTKEMLRSILMQTDKSFYVSMKNYNTLIGMSINLLNMPPGATIGVFEAGINDKGEMGELADLLRPDIGVITNISHAHAKGLGTLHEIADEKCMLFKNFTQTSIGVLNGDRDILINRYFHHPITKFGFKTTNQVQARKVQTIQGSDGTLQTSFLLKWYGQKRTVILAGNHRGFVANALAAASVCYLLDISLDHLAAGIERFPGVEHRFEIKQLAHNRGTMICDCYNANPESMKAALHAFEEIKTDERKVAVLGDMLELGEKEVYWHRQIGRLVNQLGSIDAVILVGPRARHMARTISSATEVEIADNWKIASSYLEKHVKGHKTLVLLKASRDIQLGKIVNLFTQ